MEKEITIKISVPEGTTNIKIVPTYYKFEKGDFIYIKSSSGYEYIGIYKSQDQFINVFAYLWFDKDMPIFLQSRAVGIESIETIRLATDKEKELLLNRLHDVNYDWDNQQIVKYKWKPNINEIYYTLSIINTINTIFKVYSYKWGNDSFDNYLFDHNLVYRTKKECEVKCAKLNKAIEDILHNQ